MENKGPSPLVPSLMVTFLGMAIFGPTISLFVVLLILSLFLLNLIGSCFPTIPVSLTTDPTLHDQTTGAGGRASDPGWFGFGTFLLFVLYAVLYTVVSQQHL